MYKDMLASATIELENVREAVVIAGSHSLNPKKISKALRVSRAGTMVEDLYSERNVLQIADRLVERGYLIKSRDGYKLSEKAKKLKPEMEAHEKDLAQGLKF